jgi:uncharacterized membrane protein
MSDTAGGSAPVAARALALAPLGALLAIFIVWHVARFSPRTALLASLLAMLPWLPLLPGLWRARRRAQTLGLLLTTPYLGYGLMEVLANPGARAFAATTVLLAFATAVALAACQRLSPEAAAAPRERTGP